eukprot:TRINITY_DN121775_c0_g1_i1.p1 TRINITY_DN121775_c0_g1~~TRINITY_DN121775_c0_g1_i1.p1  ORF type:complete len:342 (+),score=81.48 TRINITY_DN121775_c0_g1_i1:113-1027(+)
MSIRVIQEGDTALVERLGKFHKQLQPGFHILIPFIDSVRTRLTVREQVLDIPPQACITADNAPLKADAVVYFRIFDAKKAVYSVDALIAAVQNLVLTQLRAEVGKLTLDETFSAREKINSTLLRDLDEATDPWGVKITRVEVRDIIPNREILASMEMQMAAERTKRAQIIKSEGEKMALLNAAAGEAEARVVRAESEKTAQILRAEAEQVRLLKEADGLAAAVKLMTAAAGGDSDRAVKVQLMKAYIDSQVELSRSPNTKVLLFPSAEDCGAKQSSVLSELQGSNLASALDSISAKLGTDAAKK